VPQNSTPPKPNQNLNETLWPQGWLSRIAFRSDAHQHGTPQRNVAFWEKRMNRPRIVLTAFILSTCLLSRVAAAQTNHANQPPAHRPAKPQSPSASQPVSSDPAIHAMFDVHTFSQAEISPDGKSVAWVEELAGPSGAPSSDAAIYFAPVDAPMHPARITAGDGRAPHEEHDVAWSPDCKRIAFLSDAATNGQLQLFVLDVNAPADPKTKLKAKPKQLSHFKGFVSNPAWSPDGKTIAVLYTENATRAAGPLVAETPEEGVVSDSYYEQRLALIDPITSSMRQISPVDTYIYEFDWAPDSSQLVVSSAKGNGDNNWWVAGLFTIDAASGSMRPIFEKPGTQIATPRWSPDGKQVAFIGGLMSDEGITGGDVFTVPASGGAARNLTPGMTQSASSLNWTPDSVSIIFTGIGDGETVITGVSATDGKLTYIWRGAEKVAFGPFTPSISLARDGRTSAAIRQSFTRPPEIYAGPIGAWKQITNSNVSLTPTWGKVTSLHWTTEIGTVQGWLIYPANFDAMKKYPMVVDVHGGPAYAHIPAWPSRWAYYMALSSHGYFIFLPNPRGSYGEGEKFTQGNVRDFGYGDFLDIMAGVDKAIESAPVDPKRLGITGWSYGGYMTMWAVTKTNRFAAAVSGAGLADWLSYYGENKIDQWMIPYFGATVYDDPAVYAKSAPINFIKNVKTPTLLVVGDRDGECPAPQSFEFWHALKTLGVPTQFAIYPNEGHMFISPEHSRDVIARTLAWFNRYLSPTPK
jgi:dipeptidyl aminopeptidase/acylaminoacyl peptidase